MKLNHCFFCVFYCMKYTMVSGYFTRLVFVTIVLVNSVVFARVINKVSSTGVQDTGTPDVSSSVTGEINYAEDGITANNVSQSGKQINYVAESSNKPAAGTGYTKGSSESISTKKLTDPKSKMSPAVTSEVKAASAVAKSEVNTTETEAESGVMSTASEAGIGDKHTSYETETGNQSNNTSPGSYDVPTLPVQSGQPNTLLGGQTANYDIQPNIDTIKSKSNSNTLVSKTGSSQIQFGKNNGSSEQQSASKVEQTYNDTESSINSKEAVTSEQLTAPKSESYERSNQSSVESTITSNSSVTTASEQLSGSEMESYDRSYGSSTNQSNKSVNEARNQLLVTSSEMETYDQSKVPGVGSINQPSSQAATSSQQLTVPEIRSYDQSKGSGMVSMNESSSIVAESKETSTGVDTVSQNIPIDVYGGSAGKPSSSDTKASPKPQSLEASYGNKQANSGLETGQQLNVNTVRGLSASSNANAKGTSSKGSNENASPGKTDPIVKTQSSSTASGGSRPYNTSTSGVETGSDQPDVDSPSSIGSQYEMGEGMAGPDGGEQPEVPEGIQHGPCARFPFRIEGNKVIFDVEMNCQLSVNLDVAKQLKGYGPNSQGKGASNLFEIQTSSGTTAVDGTCPKLQAFIVRNGIVYINTSPNCHLIIHPDRLTTGRN